MENKPLSRQSSEEEQTESSATDSSSITVGASVSEGEVKSSSSGSVSSVSTDSTLHSEEQLGSSAADSGYRESSFSVSSDTTVIPVTTKNTGTSDPNQPSSSGSMGTLSDVGSLSSEAADLLSPSVEHSEGKLAAPNRPLGRALSHENTTSEDTEKKSALKRTKSCEESPRKWTEKEQAPKSVDSDSSDDDLPSVSQYEPMEEEESEASGRSVSEESGEKSSDNNPSEYDYKKLEESESDVSETVRK